MQRFHMKLSMKVHVRRLSGNEFVATRTRGSNSVVFWGRISDLICIALSLPQSNSNISVVISEVYVSCQHILGTRMNIVENDKKDGQITFSSSSIALLSTSIPITVE